MTTENKVIEVFSGDHLGKLCFSEPPQEADGAVHLGNAEHDQTIW